jgi:hypothetical protein
VLLTSEDELAQRMSAEALATYVDRIVQAVEKHFGPRPDVTTLVLRVDLFPAGELHVSAAGDVDERLVIPVLEGLERPPVRGGPVRFELLLATSDNDGDC